MHGLVHGQVNASLGASLHRQLDLQVQIEQLLLVLGSRVPGSIQRIIRAMNLSDQGLPP